MNQERDYNICKFRGNLTKKPVLKGGERKYAHLTIACNRNYQNENGKYEADFINLKLWKDAEKIVEELDKGQKVEIESHYKSGSYTNLNGEKIYTNELIVDKIDYSLLKEKENQESKEISNELEK